MKMLTMIAAASLAAMALAAEKKPEGKGPRSHKAPSAERAPMHREMNRQPGAFRGPGMGIVQDPLSHALMNPRLAEKLNLTDEQKAKLGTAADVRAKNRELQEKARKAMEHQIELLQAEAIDEAAVMAAIDEAFEARKAIAKEQTKRVILIRSVLTPEQVKIATESLKEMRGPGRRPDMKDGKKGERKGGRTGVRPDGDGDDMPPPPPEGDAPKDEGEAAK